MNLKTQFTRFTLAAGALLLAGGAFAQQNTLHGPREQGSQTMSAATTQTLHKTVQVDGVEIFYREAGPKDAPTVLLLHGFPTSSHMFRNLIPQLAERYHVLAPDYPGFGASVTQADLDKAAHSLNGRPRQTLDWMSPSEKLAEVLQ